MLTIVNIAEQLGVNPESVRRWIRTNKLEATMSSRKGGFIVTEVSLEKFLEKYPKYRRQSRFELDAEYFDEAIEESTKKLAMLRAELENISAAIAEEEKRLNKLKQMKSIL